MKNRFTYIFLAVAIVCLSVIPFFNYKNQTVAKASGEGYKEIASSYVYLLPAVNVTYSPQSSTSNYVGVVPSVFVVFNSNMEFDGIYTMTASSSRNNFYWGKRAFTKVSGTNFLAYESTAPLSLVIQYQTSANATTGGQINWSASHTANVYYSPSSNDSINFTYGTYTVNSNATDGMSYVYYEMTGTAGLYFQLNLYFDPGSTLMNYTGSFSPTALVTNGTSGDFQQGYDSGYEKGYYNGKIYGEGIGYERGVNDANTYSFGNLLSAVVDVPINSFKSLLNFDFLGINLLDFSLALLTFVLIIKIVGLVTGG